MIVGVSMCRDEQDIISSVIAHLLNEGVDHLIVADNLSVDNTRAILHCFLPHITVVNDQEVGYYQARKMSNLAHQAGAMGADWVLPFDADELWYSPAGSLADVIGNAKANVLQAVTYHHVPHPDDPDELDPILRMGHRIRGPKSLSKVAFRYHPDARLHMGNHDVDLPDRVTQTDVLEIREFQYRTFEQFKRKVRNGKQAYDATDLHAMYGTHWRRMGAMSDEVLRGLWDEHVGQDGLVYDPAPFNRGLSRLAS